MEIPEQLSAARNQPGLLDLRVCPQAQLLTGNRISED